MRKEKSWTRQMYELAYRRQRYLGDCEHAKTSYSIDRQFIKAADYSYQAYWHDLSGWTSISRRRRFHAILCRVYASRGEIPF